MDVKVYKATLADLDKLLSWRMEVLKEVFDLQDEPDEKLYKANERYYKDAFANDSHLALFAEVKGKTVGCGGVCFYQEMPSPDNPNGKCAYLMNIYIRRPYRRKGIARKIVSTIIDEAKKRGITKIYLETSEEARELYESVGFSDMKDYLILKENKKTDK